MSLGLTIGLDFDNTYTADRGLWDAFIALAKKFGHRVVCVTSRFETAENFSDCDIPGVLTYFTGMVAKDFYMRETHGIGVDIWIEDDPGSVFHGR